MSECIHTLYSSSKKRIILTLVKKCFEDNFSDKCAYTRILAINDGKGYILCKGAKTEFSSGDIFVFDSEIAFEIFAEEGTQISLLKFSLCDFVDGEYKIFSEDVIKKLTARIDNNILKLSGIHFNSKRLSDAVFMIENEFENRSDSSDYVIKAYLLLILSLAMQYLDASFKDTELNKTAHLKSIEKSLVYISENLTEKFSLEELARIANMGKTNYSLAFKEVTGMTVWEYILNARVELAVSYLVEKKDNFNITEIAHMCGFSDAAHFTKTFKKIRGSTPRSFKKETENPCF